MNVPTLSCKPAICSSCTRLWLQLSFHICLALSLRSFQICSKCIDFYRVTMPLALCKLLYQLSSTSILLPLTVELYCQVPRSALHVLRWFASVKASLRSSNSEMKSSTDIVEGSVSRKTPSSLMSDNLSALYVLSCTTTWTLVTSLSSCSFPSIN